MIRVRVRVRVTVKVTAGVRVRYRSEICKLGMHDFDKCILQMA